ncbi:er membrane protein complex subunit 3-like isoform x1 [Plasmopara halstedii]|uniref:ER membrane protein complex subunit 3 n=1 Tax=Plasmopara halstedii TaxID=4781 RepID=A0A0N7L6B4_PLAHL|nr:er membrane protein complex subunit 3-like isoform x1 [Plasmopara halstedii]CEG43803.1 er membrane protein complex subunit 3-like isoform x1 [Plasmopara halstedii]|eukprot:XP_024580172.1 er membrane protein complex subunit 3-like isoform x1 [Plasmopara halstedii]
MVEIILDPSIRDWVVLPMIIIFGCSAMIRHYVTLLLKNDKMASVEQLMPMNTVKRAQITRVNSKFIAPYAFAMRKHYFTASQKKDGMKGALREKVKSEAMNQMMNPNSMLEMMKGNMTFMVSNFVMMGLMSYFFGGFVLAKVPFSLTQKFKMMLQRGIDLKYEETIVYVVIKFLAAHKRLISLMFSTLDVSYVSSVSWYFLVSFGMRGFLSLILGEQSASDDAKAMQMQMGVGAGPNMAFDAPKVYKQERVSLRLHNHDWALEFAEKKLLGESIPTNAKSSTTSSSHTSTVKEKRASKFTKVSKRNQIKDRPSILNATFIHHHGSYPKIPEDDFTALFEGVTASPHVLRLFKTKAERVNTSKPGRVNGKVQLEKEKVVDFIPVCDVEDVIKSKGKCTLCRCWKSKNFPYCDGSHLKHNKETGDNVGPLVLTAKSA